MLRFLRQYNKGILVVGGVLLMVAWAISGTFSQLAQESSISGRVWATVDGRDVRGEEVMQAQAELRVIEVLQSGTSSVIAVPEAAGDLVHYYLLQREARDSGLVGTADDGLLSITRQLNAARATNPEIPSAETFVANVAQAAGQPPQVVIETIAKLNGINRLVGLYEGAPRLSDRRMRNAAARMLSAVDADIVVLDARRLATAPDRPLDWTPTEEQLQKQLAEFGDKTVNATTPFGYKLPNRLKVEWLVIPIEAVRKSIETSDQLGNIELRKHRDRNAAIFLKPADGSDDFETVREAVRAHRLDQLVEQRMAEIAKFASDQLQMPLRSAPRDGVYAKLPEDWAQRQLSFENLAATIATQFNVALPAWQSSGAEWMEPAAVDRLPGLGSATSDRFGPTPVKASQLLSQLREFGGNDAFALQASVAGPPLKGPSGDVVLFRVIEADPARAPRSVDEVRDRLVADLKAVEQYDRLVKQLAELKTQAGTEGLLAVASAHGTTVQTARNVRESDPRFFGSGIKMTSPLPGLGAPSAEATLAIVEAGAALPAGTPIASVPEAERLFGVAVQDRLAVVLGRVTGVTPLVREDFEMLASSGAIEQSVLGDDTSNLRKELFSREALTKRMNFKLAQQVEEAVEKIEDEAAKAAS